MFVLRDVSPGDLDDLHAAARHLDSVNLPDDRERLRQLIEISEQSFAGEIDVAARRFVFVLVDQAPRSARVVGASMIFAQHGSRRAPHIYFDVIEEERYSETLDKHFSHQLLRIGYNYKGLTEIGGLVLLPEYRRRPEHLGRALSYVRFLYMALHRRLFCGEVVSELMPPLEPDGTSLLWESLGRRFTGLSYQEADRLSHQNKEFIRALFPQDPLYVTLLPPHVQELVGQVGPKTKGVEKMLREIGFEYSRRIDPFDGGPHFHALTDEITLVGAVTHARVVAPAVEQEQAQDDPAALESGPRRSYLVARESSSAPYFLAMKLDTPPPDNDGRLALPRGVREVLRASLGDDLALLPS
ncbi:MAG TPA: arginine N-succinyltransferase [Polyangia bacterium]|jgi:arginine N-succinyltransferase|nr:arginine N-succinyltransferase [Polyangia bacterium]